jgi:hypothetical protein
MSLIEAIKNLSRSEDEKLAALQSQLTTATADLAKAEDALAESSLEAAEAEGKARMGAQRKQGAARQARDAAAERVADLQAATRAATERREKRARELADDDLLRRQSVVDQAHADIVTAAKDFDTALAKLADAAGRFMSGVEILRAHGGDARYSHFIRKALLYIVPIVDRALAVFPTMLKNPFVDFADGKDKLAAHIPSVEHFKLPK